MDCVKFCGHIHIFVVIKHVHVMLGDSATIKIVEKTVVFFCQVYISNATKSNFRPNNMPSTNHIIPPYTGEYPKTSPYVILTLNT